MNFDWSQVCARRLVRHGLAGPGGAGPEDVVAAMAGTHAQVMSAAELSVALRVDGATRDDVRTALWTDRTLVKTFGPRGTVHLLPARDLPLWTAALSAIPPGPSPFPERMRMTSEQAEAVIAAIATVLDGVELTADELTSAVVGVTGSWAGDLVMPAFQGMWPRWRQVMHVAGMRGVLCFGPGRGRKVTYTNPGHEPAPTREGLAHVVHAYLHAYGPSTPKRFAHWLTAPVRWATEVFGSLGDSLQKVEVDGAPAWVTTGDLDVPAERPEGVRLLPYFDGYAYRVGNQPPDLLYPGAARARVLPGNFQILLVDGVVGGLWHQRRSGRRVDITVEPLVRLTPRRREELDAQVARVGEIIDAVPNLTIGQVTVGGHA
ncbi:winged helix DNA-binding domain-containing protein [Actinomadura sp. DC4]|uniref:winged helix DNA-binding domain-containing protein n=1 Tax=Actinomadura sp. DC4 TaxID=3055069 RepID=UPI0025B1B46D|nr:winged helix DNA-binding domain-containing protein [Actinomadura sp. DC4]MDN3358762.1 winged helix DNA-binding domain-containing protein [Actinomadura sp. DC4]